MAICDALLDYYLPNQVQRERAHRDLMARDGLQESRLGLLKTPTSDGRVVAAVVAGVGGGVSGAAGNNSGGRDEAGVRGSEPGEGRGEKDGEGRDVDDDVSALELYLLLAKNTSEQRLLSATLSLLGLRTGHRLPYFSALESTRKPPNPTQPDQLVELSLRMHDPLQLEHRLLTFCIKKQKRCLHPPPSRLIEPLSPACHRAEQLLYR